MKKCETFGCKNEGISNRQLAPGTNVWLCEPCWEVIKRDMGDDDQVYFDSHAV